MKGTLGDATNEWTRPAFLRSTSDAREGVDNVRRVGQLSSCTRPPGLCICQTAGDALKREGLCNFELDFCGISGRMLGKFLLA